MRPCSFPSFGRYIQWTIRWCFVNQYICWLVFSFHYVSAFVYRYATLMLDQTQQALYIKVICVVLLLLPEFIDWQIVPLDCSDNYRAQEHPAEALLSEIRGEGKLFHQGYIDHMTMESNHLCLNPVLNSSWGQREQLQTISLRRTTTNSPGFLSPMLEASQTQEAEPQLVVVLLCIPQCHAAYSWHASWSLRPLDRWRLIQRAKKFYMHECT
jgi:hypothetical protein